MPRVGVDDVVVMFAKAIVKTMFCFSYVLVYIKKGKGAKVNNPEMKSAVPPRIVPFALRVS